MDPDPNLMHIFLGAHESELQMEPRSVQPVFAGLTNVWKSQTHSIGHNTSVETAASYAQHAIRPNNSDKKKH